MEMLVFIVNFSLFISFQKLVYLMAVLYKEYYMKLKKAACFSIFFEK